MTEFLYPHPLTLARNRAELSDPASMRRAWGQLGGLSTYYRYGPSWFSLLALKRWGRITAQDLDAVRVVR